MFAAVFAVAPSCSHDPINPNPTPTDTTGTTCHPDTVYFVNEVLPIITSNCASSNCHDNIAPKEGIALTSYSKIVKEVSPGNPSNSELYEVLFKTGNKQMPPPPAAALDSTSKWKIKTWIQQGALNNECSECDTTSGSYSLTIVPTLQAQCISCHSATNASGGVKLTTHSEVVSAVNNSGLMAAINRTSASPMPPASALSDCQLAQFQKWIDNGMPNN
jgi:hypothetical protein